MRKLLVLLTGGVLLCGVANAKKPTAVIDPSEMEVIVPEYVYCEILANDTPSYTGDGVIFDFGQQTGAWAYNWLKDADGKNLYFESGIGALNHMVCRGWEFVQAYTAGKDVRSLHYLLRFPTSKLSQEQLQQLLAPPRTRSKAASKNEK